MSKIWDEHPSWESAETAWEKRAKSAAQEKPLKRLKVLPQMPGITPETARFLKWKSFKYMLFHPQGAAIFRHFCRHPLRYGLSYLKSLRRKKGYFREGDFFLYNLSSTADFLKRVKKKEALLVVGFSYCQKPFECPSGRFTPDCIRDPAHPVCAQCEIGKALHALPEVNVIPLLIPTVHYIGQKIFETVHKHPEKEVLFLITACEMTLEMFADWGNMVGIRGIGVRLDGRICNTMRAFELSEEGIKPGLTVLTETTLDRLFALIRDLRE
jgi:hypothetical protein